MSNITVKETKLIAVDTETFLIEDYYDRSPKLVCMSWQKEDHEPRMSVEMEKIHDVLTNILQDDSLVVCGANIAYDAGVLMKQFPDTVPLWFAKYEKKLVWDVLVGAMLYVIEKGLIYYDEEGSEKIHLPDGSVLYTQGATGKIAERFSLASATYFFTGRSDAKGNADYRLRYGELSEKPLDQWPPSARQYPLDDAKNTLDVALAQQLIANRRHIHIHTKAGFCMELGSVHGLEVDVKAVDRLNKSIGEDYENAVWFSVKNKVLKPKNMHEQLNLLLGDDYKDEPKYVLDKAFVASELKRFGDPVTFTDTGQVKTTKDVFESATSPNLRAHLDFLAVNKYKTSYLPKFVDAARVHGSMGDRPNPLLATGRASYNGMSQLYPPKMREAFMARAGTFLCSIDYAALELCSFAQVCLTLFGYSRMAEVINKSKDPGSLHTILGCALAGRTDLEQFTKEVKAKDPIATMFRALAKVGNFGFLGGMGAAGIVKSQKLKNVFLCVVANRTNGCYRFEQDKFHGTTCSDCLAIAKDLKKNFLNTWPETKDYFSWVRENNVSGETSRIISPITGFIRSGLSYTSFANHPFQHLAAVGTKIAMWDVTKECYLEDKKSVLFGSRPILAIHDEILAELPIEKAHEAAYRMRDLMVEGQRKLIKDVHIGAEPALMIHWNKKADTKFDSNGRLIPWDL